MLVYIARAASGCAKAQKALALPGPEGLFARWVTTNGLRHSPCADRASDPEVGSRLDSMTGRGSILVPTGGRDGRSGSKEEEDQKESEITRERSDRAYPGEGHVDGHPSSQFDKVLVDTVRGEGADCYEKVEETDGHPEGAPETAARVNPSEVMESA